jgi:hypothetical protein
VSVVVHETGTDPSTVKVAEAARILDCSTSALYELARTTGELVPGIPFVRIGTTLRLPRARLIAYAAGEWKPGES